jgi:hypothetical protein
MDVVQFQQFYDNNGRISRPIGTPSVELIEWIISKVKICNGVYVLYNATSTLNIQRPLSLLRVERITESHDVDKLQIIYDLCVANDIPFNCTYSSIGIIPYNGTKLPLKHNAKIKPVHVDCEKMKSMYTWWLNKYLDGKFKISFDFICNLYEIDAIEMISFIWNLLNDHSKPFEYTNNLIWCICDRNYVQLMKWLVSKHETMGIPFTYESDVIDACCIAGSYEMLMYLWDIRDTVRFSCENETLTAAIIGGDDRIISWLLDTDLGIQCNDGGASMVFNNGNVKLLDRLYSLGMIIPRCELDNIPAHDIDQQKIIESLDWMWKLRDVFKMSYTDKLLMNCIVYKTEKILQWYFLRVREGMEFKYDKVWLNNEIFTDEIKQSLADNLYLFDFELQCIINNYEL